ncbi:shwachman-Bodian-diamond syndrome protein [Thozetella sp. PMI_491]|nr:shwachman-Bodian-diamond syndrome protein [Thozetella sp. PMI_491]
MARGEATQVKVHYKGKDEDFLVFVDNAKEHQDWLKDRSIPLSHVVSSFKVFITHKHGVQGTYDTASKATLENEFGTAVDEDVIKAILEKGSVQESQFAERQGVKNDTQGGLVAH